MSYTKKLDIELSDIVKYINANSAKDVSEILSEISIENLKVGKDYCNRLLKNCAENKRDYFIHFGNIGNTYSKYILYCDTGYKLYCFSLSLSKEDGVKIIEYCVLENIAIFNKYISRK
jgi:hypothetical protein